MTDFKIPRTFMGEDGAKNYKRIMSGKYDKKPETQKSFVSGFFSNGFVSDFLSYFPLITSS